MRKSLINFIGWVLFISSFYLGLLYAWLDTPPAGMNFVALFIMFVSAGILFRKSNN